VSGYATREDGFSEDHRYAFERIASTIADRLHTLQFPQTASTLVKFRSAERR
jgi:hypothetical protein